MRTVLMLAIGALAVSAAPTWTKQLTELAGPATDGVFQGLSSPPTVVLSGTAGTSVETDNCACTGCAWPMWDSELDGHKNYTKAQCQDECNGNSNCIFAFHNARESIVASITLSNAGPAFSNSDQGKEVKIVDGKVEFDNYRRNVAWIQTVQRPSTPSPTATPTALPTTKPPSPSPSTTPTENPTQEPTRSPLTIASVEDSVGGNVSLSDGSKFRNPAGFHHTLQGILEQRHGRSVTHIGHCWLYNHTVTSFSRSNTDHSEYTCFAKNGYTHGGWLTPDCDRPECGPQSATTRGPSWAKVPVDQTGVTPSSDGNYGR